MTKEVAQRAVDNLVMRLYGGLNFCGKIEVIDWLCELNESMIEGVDIHNQEIIMAFKAGHVRIQEQIKSSEQVVFKAQDTCKNQIISYAILCIRQNKVCEEIHELAEKYKSTFNL